MSVLFGGKGKGTGPTRLNDLAVQSSSLGLALTKGWGTWRIKANLMWYGDFKSVGKTQKQGGKGTVKSTTYTYFASVIMGLADGPIISVPTVYKDKEVSTLAAEGLGLATGTAGQPVWSYMTSNHPTEALEYSEIAYVYASNYPLSESATLPNHSFEVKFTTGVGGGSDANPKDILTDIFTSSTSGIPGWGAGLLGSLTDYSNYCLAEGLLLSYALEAQEKAGDFIQQQIIDATNSNIFWSEGVLKVKPRGDKQVTGNSVTWTPDLTPIYDLNEDDFLDVEDPVTQEIKDQSDAYNKVQIEYLDRSNQYNTAIEPAQDLANIITYGARKEDPVTMHSICDKQVANKVANIRLQQKLYIREEYKFRLDDTYILLEQGDYVTLTTTTDKLQLNRLPVRILEIDEDEEGNYDVTAEAVTFGTASPALYPTHPSYGYISDEGIAPGNVTNPVIMNAPLSLTNGVPEVWVAAGSSSASWGGCEVWMSFDNANYSFQGLIDQPGRYGTLTATLPLANDPDNSNTLKVDLSSCRGQLLGVGTSTERDSGGNTCLIDDEIVAFKDATLTGSFTYDLTNLRRGLYNSIKNSHSSGTKFLRVDSNMLRLDYSNIGYGRNVYFKFLSFNIYGKSLQQLSDVSPVTFYSLPKADFLLDDNTIYDAFNYSVPGEAEAKWINPGVGLAYTNALTMVSAAGQPGGTSLRVGRSSGGSAYQPLMLRQSIPYNPEDIYEVSFKVEVESGPSANATMYLGLAALDINGANLPGDFGTFNYVALAGTLESTIVGVRTFTGYVFGSANTGSSNNVGTSSNTLDNPAKLPTGTVRIAPIALLHYSNDANPTTGFVKFHEFTLRKIEDNNIRWLGDYSNLVTYRTGDGVRSAQNRLFTSRVDNNLNHTPPTTAVSDSYWRFVMDAPTNGTNGLNGASSFTMVPHGNTGALALTPTTVGKTSSNANWNAGVYSKESYTAGCIVSGRFNDPTCGAMFGLNSDPTTDASYTSLDLAFYNAPSGPSVILYSNGSPIQVLQGSVALATDTWTLLHDPTTNKVYPYKNGSPIGTPVTVSSGVNYAFDSSIYNTSAGPILSDLVFVPSGAKGEDGQDAKLVKLTSSSYSFVIDIAGNPSPSSVLLTASGQNLSGSPTFNVTTGSATLTGTGNTRTLTYANMSTDVVSVTATWDGQTDIITLSKLRAGTHGISVLVPNSTHTFPANSSGVVSDYADSGTTIQVYEGANALTFHTVNAAGRFTIGTPVVSPVSSITVGARSGSGTTTCTVANHSGASSSTDAITITYPVTATRADGTAISFNVTQSLTKSKTGENAISVSPSSQNFTINCTNNGTPKSGEFNKVVTLKVLQGTTDLTTDVNTSYSSNFTGSGWLGSRTANVITLTGITVDTGADLAIDVKRFGITVSTIHITGGKNKDGAAVVRGSNHPTAMPNSTSRSQIGSNIDLSVPDGATLTANMNMGWQATTGNIYAGEIQLSIENLTDAGSPSFSSAVSGDITATDSEPAFANISGFSMTNTTGATKTFRVKAYGKRLSGSGSAPTTGASSVEATL